MTYAMYKVDLHLSSGYLIEIENEVSINDESPVRLPASLTLFYPLINQEVREISRSGTGLLSFTFDQGDVLHIHDSSKQFECYSISLNGKTLVIV